MRNQGNKIKTIWILNQKRNPKKQKEKKWVSMKIRQIIFAGAVNGAKRLKTVGNQESDRWHHG